MPDSVLLGVARTQVFASLDAVEAQLAQLHDDQAGDTKSSAGDKFETSREMLQQELNRLEAQRAVLQDQVLQLALVERAEVQLVVGFGSLVTLLTGERYLISCGLGRLRAAGSSAWAISVESPLGHVLLGMRAGEERAFGAKTLRVAAVT